MKSVFEILEEVEGTQGTKAKTELLAHHVSNVRLAEVLQLTHDPYVNFYIGKVPKVKASKTGGASDGPLDELLKALKQCMSGDLRGNAGRDLITGVLEGMTELELKWASRIILKKMRLGVGDSTIEKLWPGLLSTFEVALAKEIDWEMQDDKLVLLTTVTYPVRIEPKWDGFRCIAVKSGGKVTLFARSGRVFDRAKKIDAWLEKHMQDGWVLDGELMGEEWNDTASIVSSKKNHKDDSALNYFVFDCLPLDVWKTHSESKPYVDRLTEMYDLLDGVKGPVFFAEGRTVKNEEELLKYYHECVEKGYEGIMIKRLDTPYVFDRSMNVMKLKPIVTYDGVVTEVLEGKEGTKWEGTFSRIRVQLPGAPMLLDGPAKTIVGTGFKDDDRAFLNENRQKLVGRACEVEGQPPLSEDGKIRFPRFKRWREEWDVSPEIAKLIKEFKA